MKTNFIRKILSGTLILLTGVLLLPAKSWAEPTDEYTVTISSATFNGKYEGQDNKVECVIELETTIDSLSDATTAELYICKNGDPSTKVSLDTLTIDPSNPPRGSYTYTVSYSDFMNLLGTVSASGTYSVDVVVQPADPSCDPFVENESVSIYEPVLNPTPSGKGHFDCNPEYGLEGNKYTATYEADSTGFYVKSPPTSDFKTITEITFGATPCDITLSNDPVFTISPTFETNLTGGQNYRYEITATHPASVDPSKFNLTSGTPSGTCSLSALPIAWDSSSGKGILQITNVKGNGSVSGFSLNYDSTPIISDILTITSDTSVTFSADSNKIKAGETKTITATMNPNAVGTPVSIEAFPSKDTVGYSFNYSKKSSGYEWTITLTAKSDTSAGTIDIVVTPSVGSPSPYTVTVEAAAATPVENITLKAESDWVMKGGTLQFIATVTPKKAIQDVEWRVTDATGVSISENGLLKVTSKATVDSVKVSAVTIGKNKDGKRLSTSKTITIKTGVPVEKITLPITEITKGYSIDLSQAVLSPENHTASTIKWEVASGVGTVKTTDGIQLFSSDDAGKATLKATIKYQDGTKDTKTFDVTVLDKPTASFNLSSDTQVNYKFPDKIITSNMSEKNIVEVKGYCVEVLNSAGNVAYTTKVEGREGTISKSTIENYIRSASSNLTNDEEKIRIRIKPYGKSQLDESKEVINDAFYFTSDEIKAYRVTVSGTNVKSTTVYGQEGLEVQITAEPTSSSYKFSKWSDGNTNNPRTVKISSNPSENRYVATMVSSKQSSSSSSGSSDGDDDSTSGSGRSSKSSGSDSKYDKVPKTGENMAIYWVVIVAVLSGSGVAAVLYNMARSEVRSWKGEDDGNEEKRKTASRK